MQLAALDFLALLGYILLLALVAWRMGRAGGEAKDYFWPGARFPGGPPPAVWATAMTAASVLGLPQAGYAGNLVDIGANIAALIAVVLIIGGVVPRVLQAGQVTVYRMLDQRYSVLVRQCSAWFFMAGRSLASGARLYIAGMALAWIFAGSDAGWVMALGMAALVGMGLLLASWGGIKSVIATDVLQAGIFMLVPAIILYALWSSTQVDTSVMIEALHMREGGSAFNWFNGALGKQGEEFSWSVLFSENYSFLAILIAWPWLYFAVYGTDQDLAQRMLSTGSNGLRAAPRRWYFPGGNYFTDLGCPGHAVVDLLSAADDAG